MNDYMKQILFILLASLLVIGVVSIAEAASYRNIVNVKFYGKAECIAQKTDEVYWRITSNVKDAEGEHRQLIAKGELENLGNYLKNLEAQDKPLIATFKSTFDLKKFQSKYHTILKVEREYIELYKPGTHTKIFSEYKYQDFKKTRYTYSWNHGVNLGC